MRSNPIGRRAANPMISAAVLMAIAASAVAQDQAPVVPPPPVFAPPPGTAPAPVFAPQPAEAFPAPAPQQDPAFFGQAPQPIGAVESPKRILKNMFATSLAAMTQTVGGAVLTGLTQAITGGITNWFSRKPRDQAQAAAVADAAPAASLQPALPPAPVFDAAGTAAPPAFAAATAPQPAFAPAPQFFDAQTGAATAPDPLLAQALAAPDAGGVFAGLAFEVHALLPGGTTAPVDPATHVFRTGDRFVVHYRPTLPGQMTVFNINPAGIQAQIDRVDLAAGQLAQLGPYEFAAMTGDEQLRLVLSPCSTPELLLATRDIINVAGASPAAPALNLAACSPATRSIRDVPTRDIRKVGVEGTTAFALDPVSAGEFSSGQVAPREVTIVFRHR